jgi:hypothetical protein
VKFIEENGKRNLAWWEPEMLAEVSDHLDVLLADYREEDPTTPGICIELIALYDPRFAEEDECENYEQAFRWASLLAATAIQRLVSGDHVPPPAAE